VINDLYNHSLHVPDLVILLSCVLFFGAAGVPIAIL
jgi:hypothetical protein